MSVRVSCAVWRAVSEHLFIRGYIPKDVWLETAGVQYTEDSPKTRKHDAPRVRERLLFPAPGGLQNSRDGEREGHTYRDGTFITVLHRGASSRGPDETGLSPSGIRCRTGKKEPTITVSGAEFSREDVWKPRRYKDDILPKKG